MLTKKEIKNIKVYLTELSSRSVGVPEFLDLVNKNPDLLSYLGFKNIKELQKHVDEIGYDEFNELRKEASEYMQEKLNTIEDEKEEILRTSKELNIDYDLLLNSFKSSREVELDRKMWSKLENTDSHEMKRGSFKKVQDLAKKYGKRDPKIIKSQLISNNYKRPLVLSFDGRYYLVAGNTRLSTAASMGMRPKVYLASL